MPNFAYTARDTQGQLVSGLLTAGTEREAISVLSGKSLFPIEVKAEVRRKGFSFGKRVGGQLMATTFNQMGGALAQWSSAVADDQDSARAKFQRGPG